MYENRHKEAKATQCGLFMHPVFIYMAASPDSLMSYKCCGEGLLEIKCPIKIAHTDPQSCPPPYLIYNDDQQLNLNVNHPYYTQIIVQLTVTTYKWCNYFVYTPHGYYLHRIYKNTIAGLPQELHKTVKSIYTKYILSQLCTPDVDSASGKVMAVLDPSDLDVWTI